jgi:diketogulonate reductase-like aldo/keto reductase
MKAKIGAVKTETITLNDGNKMPLVGLGTWQIKGANCEAAVATALKAGYRHIDTARIYDNEEKVGKAIKKSGLKRENIFVTTKLWNDDHDAPEAALAASLERLGLDYVDLYLMHWPVPQRVETWRAMEKMKKDGLCRSIGVSNFTTKHLKELLTKAKITPAVNQVEFNPFLFQKELLEFCKSNKITLEAYSPLAHGKKTSDKKIAEIAKAYGKTPAQIMIKWITQHNVVAIPKSTNEARIKENFSIFDFALTAADMKKIDTMNEDFRTCWDPTNIP